MDLPIDTRQETWAVRLATEQDAAALTEIYRPYVESSPITFEIDPPNEADMKRRIQETLSSLPWLVAESASSRIIGYAYATTHSVRAAYRWSVDTSVYVDTEFHRRGVGRALYNPLFEILTALGYVNVYAGITLPNPASVALHESFGFRALRRRKPSATSVAICLRRTSRTRNLGLQREVMMRRLKKGAL